ncbi:hypothetical protein EBZ37_14700, partial [bacterium]|nr:hypothetical protein [bacterium]
QIALCEDELKMPQQAAKHRQLLTSLFPNSPAARSLVVEATTTEAAPGTAPTSTDAPATAPAAPPTAPAEGTSKQ